MLQMAVTAERICRLKYCEGEHKQDLCLQVHKERTIISSIDDEDSFGYELTEPGKVKRACYYLFNCVDQMETEPGCTEVPAIQMSKSRFDELKAKAATTNLYFLAESLTAETGDLVYSAQLARVLKYRTADGELRLCSRGTDSWTSQHASYIGDASGGWLLRMSSESAEDWIIAVPASKAEVCYALYEWMLNAPQAANPE
ncbi:hypothetical protein [Paenibacillus sp. FSL R7-0331]|uniref:hypothetical protein n=2 Tax=Paenibacillus TaxID=44249 RepID=UPI000A60203D|nr:hypothetical protein [Paenibacillus sp. FSL R7-0331]